MVVKCNRCNQLFVYEKYDGYCPKCGYLVEDNQQMVGRKQLNPSIKYIMILLILVVFGLGSFVFINKTKRGETLEEVRSWIHCYGKDEIIETRYWRVKWENPKIVGGTENGQQILLSIPYHAESKQSPVASNLYLENYLGVDELYVESLSLHYAEMYYTGEQDLESTYSPYIQEGDNELLFLIPRNTKSVHLYMVGYRTKGCIDLDQCYQMDLEVAEY